MELVPDSIRKVADQAKADLIAHENLSIKLGGLLNSHKEMSKVYFENIADQLPKLHTIALDVKTLLMTLLALAVCPNNETLAAQKEARKVFISKAWKAVPKKIRDEMAQNMEHLKEIFKSGNDEALRMHMERLTRLESVIELLVVTYKIFVKDEKDYTKAELVNTAIQCVKKKFKNDKAAMYEDEAVTMDEVQNSLRQVAVNDGMSIINYMRTSYSKPTDNFKKQLERWESTLKDDYSVSQNEILRAVLKDISLSASTIAQNKSDLVLQARIGVLNKHFDSL